MEHNLRRARSAGLENQNAHCKFFNLLYMIADWLAFKFFLPFHKTFFQKQ